MKLILIVDDNTMNLDFLKTILDANGFETLSTESGLAAVGLAKDKQPNLILMDIQMSGVDGYMALDMLRNEKITLNIPVIAVTGNGMAHDRDRIISSGFNEYIIKPYRINSLLAIIKPFLL
jgi:two-component system cell cycle response regulator DivK